MSCGCVDALQEEGDTVLTAQTATAAQRKGWLGLCYNICFLSMYCILNHQCVSGPSDGFFCPGAWACKWREQFFLFPRPPVNSLQDFVVYTTVSTYSRCQFIGTADQCCKREHNLTESTFTSNAHSLIPNKIIPFQTKTCLRLLSFKHNSAYTNWILRYRVF